MAARRVGAMLTLVVGVVGSAVLLAALGCHGDTDAGGATDRGNSHARTTTTPAAQQAQHPVPTPPTADQIDPDSPRAVLGGTSTTQTGSQGASGSAQPPH